MIKVTLGLFLFGLAVHAESTVSVQPSVVQDLLGLSNYNSIMITGDAAKSLYASIVKPERKQKSGDLDFIYKDGSNILCGHPDGDEGYFCMAVIDPLGRISKMADVQQ